MLKTQAVEAFKANGFEVVEHEEELNISFETNFLLTLDKNKNVTLGEGINELSEFKYGQLLYLVKKYQGLIAQETFKML